MSRLRVIACAVAVTLLVVAAVYLAVRAGMGP